MPSRADKAELERRRKALSRQFKRDCTKMVHRDKDTLINLQLAEIRRLQRQNAQVALRGAKLKAEVKAKRKIGADVEQVERRVQTLAFPCIRSCHQNLKFDGARFHLQSAERVWKKTAGRWAE